MSWKIKKIVNEPISSNCYVIINDEMGCVLVDPGSEDGSLIDSYVKSQNVHLDYIILTHEHFDHVWSCAYFVKKYSTPILCSKVCAESIISSRTNLSLFHDAKKAFVCPPASIIVEDGRSLQWGSNTFHFHTALGHSSCGLFIRIGMGLFTGDTLIKDLKTVTKLKCGSQEGLRQSLQYLKSLKGQGLTIFPGHGDVFELDDYDLNKALG